MLDSGQQLPSLLCWFSAPDKSSWGAAVPGVRGGLCGRAGSSQRRQAALPPLPGEGLWGRQRIKSVLPWKRELWLESWVMSPGQAAPCCSSVRLRGLAVTLLGLKNGQKADVPPEILSSFFTSSQPSPAAPRACDSFLPGIW